MPEIQIKIIDNICAEITKGKNLVKQLLSYPSTYYRPGQFRKIKTEYEKSLLFGKNSSFIYVGWIDRIKEYASKQNLSIEIYGELEILKSDNKPSIPGVKFRPYQLEAIECCIRHQRGVVNGSVGSGKTTIAAGLISCFKEPSVLYLVPTIDLLNQVHKSFTDFGFKVCKLGNGNKEITQKIVVSTIQTFSRMDLVQLSTFFDIIIGDEIHIATKSSGTIQKIFSTSLAPIRIGLSGTPPKEKEKALIIEGLIGPEIFNLGTKKAIEMDILEKPKIKLLKVPKNKNLTCRTYQDWYSEGIVNNEQRNRIIVEEGINQVNNGMNVVIFTKEIKHLENISEILSSKGIFHEKVHGVISSDERNRIKDSILKGECNLVISSVVWNVGLDIPNLSCGILAAGGKAERTQLQTIGRFLRKSEGKEGCFVVDFLDPYPHLANHAIQRISVYVELGWL